MKLNLSELNLVSKKVNENQSVDLSKLKSTEKKLMKADDYSKLELYQQILERPSMYLGSVSKAMRLVPEKILIFDPTSPHKFTFVEENMDYPVSCEKLYLEILNNASDNIINSRNRNHDIGEIIVNIDKRLINIRNGGVPIPIEMNDKHNMWTPHLLFHELLTSSTYNKPKRTGIGQNGYGAKLTNLFSKYFRCKIGDPYNKKEYIEEWRNNRSHNIKHIITEGYAGEPYVDITFEMDFERFGYTEYPESVIGLYGAAAVEVSGTCHVPVTFNGHRFEFNNFYEFSKLISGNTSSKYVIHYEYPEGTKLKQMRQNNGTLSMVSEDPNILPTAEICMMDTPDDAQIISFVNSARTKLGGIHVEAIYDELGSHVIDKINNNVLGLNDKKKGDKKTIPRKCLLNKTDLKRHVTVIVSYWIDNPECGSQEKSKFSGKYKENQIPDDKFKVKFKFEDRIIKNIMDWDMVNRLVIELQAKAGKLTAGKGKKGKRQITGTIQDAYYAGTNQGHECVLYRTEGKSALGYAYSMKSELSEEQMQYVGISCERGKPMNIMNAKLLRILASNKYQELCEHLGLTEGMDYTIDENFATLRYGMLAIMTDADVDGKHIASLLINIFYCRHPTLLQRQFLVMIRTPIIRVFKGKETLKFYSLSQYEKWAGITPDSSKWKHKYYKGLATSRLVDVAEDTQNPKKAFLIYDDKTPELMNLAFNGNLSNDRKQWIADHKLVEDIEDIDYLPISDFIKFEAVLYAIANVGRSIPRFDGLKESQRKLVFASKTKWGKLFGSSDAREIKTNQLASFTGDLTKYKYGNALTDTINRMVLDYPGTNNMPFFVKEGQFGTRNDDGDDAGDARYTHTYPEWWGPLVYRQEDEGILIYFIDEGDNVEPLVYLPIVPIFMINGVVGIGSGTSTLIPSFNPIDIIEYIKTILSRTEQLPFLIPWYRGFTGKVELRYKGPKEPKSESILNINIEKLLPKESIEKDSIYGDENGASDENIPPEIKLSDITTDEDGDVIVDDNDDQEKKQETSQMKTNHPLKVVTIGVFNVIDSKTLIVTELPIGRSIKQYDAFLAKLMELKEIKNYNNLSRHEKPKFEIFGYGKYNNINALKLVKTYSMTNMKLLDEQNKPIKFKDQYDLINQWINWRLPFYYKSKQHIMEQMYKQINDLQLKIKFIKATIEGFKLGYVPGKTVVLLNNYESEVIRQMGEINVPKEYLSSSKGKHFLKDAGVDKLETKLNKLIGEYNTLLNTTPESIWLSHLEELKKEYLKRYPEEKNRPLKY